MDSFIPTQHVTVYNTFTYLAVERREPLADERIVREVLVAWSSPRQRHDKRISAKELPLQRSHTEPGDRLGLYQAANRSSLLTVRYIFLHYLL